MKTILVPTDFSKVALNAIDYAVEIARVTKAKLILFHVYHVPVIPSEVPTILPLEEVEKDCMNGLRKIEKNIHLKNGNKVVVECRCKCGFAVDEINLFAEEHNIDMIVMGMEGASYLTEKLIGSTTTSLIRKAKCPVLAIDKDVRLRSIKKIALACDYKELKNKSILEPLKEFAHLFKSHVYVLNVVRELEAVPAMSKAVAGIKLDHLLEDVDHSFHAAKSEDVVKGINDFVDENKIDMVVMIPRMHATLKNIFQEGYTKRMAFHTKAPLLALHE